jgi:UDP-glucose 4-epimerase
MTKALVTGGSGFIGSHLVDLLLKKNFEVHVIDNLRNSHLKNIENFFLNKNFHFFNNDIRKKSTFDKLSNDYEFIFHLAGMADIVPSIENPKEYYDVNVTGTFNVLEFAKKNKLKKFVYAASSSCYGIPSQYPTNEDYKVDPQYPYALTKYLGENLVMHWNHCYKLPCISLRLFNVFGPRSRTTGAYGAVFGVFLAQKINNKPYTIVGDGNQTRDFTFVSDVANAFYISAISDKEGQIYNVGSGSHYSINYLVDILGGEKVYIPKRPGEPDCTFADINKIQKDLNWKPKIKFEKGVEVMLKNIDLWRNAPIWDQDKISKATKRWFESLG